VVATNWALKSFLKVLSYNIELDYVNLAIIGSHNNRRYIDGYESVVSIDNHRPRCRIDSTGLNFSLNELSRLKSKLIVRP
jgi:hypothetical protein